MSILFGNIRKLGEYVTSRNERIHSSKLVKGLLRLTLFMVEI